LPPPEYLLSKWFEPSKELTTPELFCVTGTDDADGGRIFPFKTLEPPCGEFSRASTSGLLSSVDVLTSPGPGSAVLSALVAVVNAGREPTK
jgi:hypothetical protein